MAEFNPMPQAEAPGSYVGLSEGIRSSPNTAIGTLFEGLAASLELGVRGADNEIKRRIEEDIFAEVDAVQAEFGIPEATALEADAEEQSLRTAPAGVQRSKEQLDRLQLAYERGALKESHYWARMNSMVRQLRGKYPGYRAEIDSMVSSITGARPANALRSALFDEWDAAARSESGMSKLEDWAVKNGRLPVDYYERQAGGSPYTETELKSYIARKQRDEAERNDRRAAIAEANDRGTLNTKDVERAFRIEANQLVTTILQDASSTAGANYAQIQKKIKEAQSAAASGNPLEAADVNVLRANMGELKATIRQALHQQFIQSWDDDPQHSYVAHLSKEQMTAVMEQSMIPLNILEDALSSDSPWGVLGSVSAWLEAQKNDAQREVIRDYPFMREFKAMSDALGSEVMGQFMSLSPSLQKEVDKVMLDWHKIMMGRAHQTGQTVADSFEDLETKEASTDVYNGLIDQWTKVADQITKQQLPIDIIQASVQYMFGPGSDRVLSKLDDDSRFEYFKKVSSPAVSRQMLKLKEQGDVDSWNTYQRWVANSFQILFKQKVNDLQSFVEDTSNYSVEWDDRNNRFKVKGIRGAFADAPLIGTSAAAERVIRQLNDTLQVVTPIIEDNDGDTTMEIADLLMNMGYDPSAVRESFLSLMVEAVTGKAKAKQEAEKKTNKGSQ